ncbi:MAG: hypothetical protein LBT05_04030, partial [Planctomycetaceae bacterium]|nr:hypothetical protein [Planctomycetaceae bacterium]
MLHSFTFQYIGEIPVAFRQTLGEILVAFWFLGIVLRSVLGRFGRNSCKHLEGLDASLFGNGMTRGSGSKPHCDDDLLSRKLYYQTRNDSFPFSWRCDDVEGVFWRFFGDLSFFKSKLKNSFHSKKNAFNSTVATSGSKGTTESLKALAKLSF